MQKLIGLMIFLAGLALSANAQNLQSERQQRLKELRLTQQQKLLIAQLIRRQRIQRKIDLIELDHILTEEQKNKLKAWKEERRRVNQKSKNK